jgi:hypothetical protein
MISRVARERKNKPSQSTKAYGSKLTGRSRITNGTRLLPFVDGRSIWARRLRDLINLHVNDYGGSDNISEAERSLIRRAAALTTELELMEVRFAAQGGADADQLTVYGRAANTFRRLLQAIGLDRRAKQVKPVTTRSPRMCND